MATEFSEILKRPEALTEWASVVVYKGQMTDEQKDITDGVDEVVRKIGETGYDRDHDLSAMIKRAFTPDVVTGASDLLDRMFDQTSIGEFDDIRVEVDPKNTFKVHEAIPGGNVERSFIDHTVLTPTYKELQAETHFTNRELRYGGYRTVANAIQLMNEQFELQKVASVMSAIQTAIPSTATTQYFDGTAATMPTETLADNLVLYLHDVSEGDTPFMFMLNKYLQKISKLAQAERWPTEMVRNMYNTTGFISQYAGCDLLGFSGQRKTAAQTLAIPDKNIFGVAGKIGTMITRGETRVLQEEEINRELTHIKVGGYSFGWVITDISKAARIVLQ